MTTEQVLESPVESTQEEADAIVRFSLTQRIEHAVLLVSFTTLGLTGLPQMFSSQPAGIWLLDLMGGIEAVRVAHRVAAVLLMLVSIFHILAVGYRVLVRRVALSMMPGVEDLRHLWEDIRFYLGRSSTKAAYGRFSYVEKAEYFAVVWGTVVMVITGFMMWNPIATARWLPGSVIPAAKAAHGGEALLAILAIILWHFYHVHIRHFNRSIFTGKLSREEMAHEHPAELAAIDAGEVQPPPPPEVIRRREQYFFPAAGLLTVALLLGLYGFVTFEQTAIETVPPGERVQAFVPFTPTPAPTAAPTATPSDATISAFSWQGQFEGLFRNRCGSCHGVTSVGGLSLATYDQALEGGTSGPSIVPGDPDASLLVQIQAQGDHPGQLTIDELNEVIEWILADAPQQ